MSAKTLKNFIINVESTSKISKAGILHSKKRFNNLIQNKTKLDNNTAMHVLNPLLAAGKKSEVYILNNEFDQHNNVIGILDNPDVPTPKNIKNFTKATISRKDSRRDKNVLIDVKVNGSSGKYWIKEHHIVKSKENLYKKIIQMCFLLIKHRDSITPFHLDKDNFPYRSLDAVKSLKASALFRINNILIQSILRERTKIKETEEKTTELLNDIQYITNNEERIMRNNKSDWDNFKRKYYNKYMMNGWQLPLNFREETYPEEVKLIRKILYDLY